MNYITRLLIISILAPRKIVECHNYDDDWYKNDENFSSGGDQIASSQPVPSPQNKRSYEEKCSVSDSGFYGNESLGNLRSAFIRYEYQMEYKRQGDINLILNDLEDAISNSILGSTTLFSECISSKSNRRKIQQLESAPSFDGIIVGLSSNPMDVVTSDECPFNSIYRDSECVVIDGILTISYEEPNSKNLEDPISAIYNVIEKGMGDGSLSLSNDQILQLDYFNNLEDGSVDLDSSKQEREIGPNDSSNLDSTALYLVFAAGGASIILIIFTLIKWRLSKNSQVSNEEHEFPDEEGSSIANELIIDDDSTNFISSKDVSEPSLFLKWKMSPSGR